GADDLGDAAREHEARDRAPYDGNRDIGAAGAAPLEQALVDQPVDRLAHGHAADAVALGQIPLRGDPVAGGVVRSLDHLDDVLLGALMDALAIGWRFDLGHALRPPPRLGRHGILLVSAGPPQRFADEGGLSIAPPGAVFREERPGAHPANSDVDK